MQRFFDESDTCLIAFTEMSFARRTPALSAVVPSDTPVTVKVDHKPFATAAASAPNSARGSDSKLPASAASDTKSADKVLIAGASGNAVQVAIRVRPLVPRELELKDNSCVAVSGGKHIEVTGRDVKDVKPFEFDHVFDRDAAQQELFDRLAVPLVQNAIDGDPATIFCYGQTGSGKTFTMQGRPGAPGIIQRVATMIETELKRDDDGDTHLVVHASYLELYLEQIRDLLTVSDASDLTIKEDPLGGVYVKDLTQRRMLSGADILSVIAEGTSRRTVAETKMNAESSRSHAVLTLTLQHVHKGDALNATRGARLSLVDLAGSERVGDTGAAGVVLAQAAKINLSLSALGNVISALCDGAKFIPFRDSKLTRLLSNSFLGRSKTLMIACVSPASSNAAETISTLRFADRAKHVKTRAVVAADPKQLRIEELEREVRRLRSVLKQCKCGLAGQFGDEHEHEEHADAPAAPPPYCVCCGTTTCASGCTIC